MQELYAAPTLLRCSFSDILLWELKSAREHDTALSEVSALLRDRAALERLYDSTVSKPYAFTRIALKRSDPNDVFHDGFGPGTTIRPEVTGKGQVT